MGIVRTDSTGNPVTIAGGCTTAEFVDYDNTGTGLQAASVQDAINELNNNLVDKISVKAITSIPIASIGATQAKDVTFNIPQIDDYVAKFLIYRTNNTNSAIVPYCTAERLTPTETSKALSIINLSTTQQSNITCSALVIYEKK